MRFLIFAAILGYASASAILYGVNPGDAQAAAIDATVAAQDQARLINENHARSAELSRDLHENAYWNGVAASQDYVAAAQSQAAALSGVVAARAAYPAPLAAAPWGVAPLGWGGAYAHGLHAW